MSKSFSELNLSVAEEAQSPDQARRAFMGGTVSLFVAQTLALAGWPANVFAQSSSSSSSESGGVSNSGDGGGAGGGSPAGNAPDASGTPGGAVGGATTAGVNDVAGMTTSDQGERIILIDVRPRANFAKGHLRGAKNLDVRYSGVLKEHVFDKSVLGTDKTKPIVIYGADARDSAAAAVARQAVAEGFTNVVWMRGGFSEWVAARLPVATS